MSATPPAMAPQSRCIWLAGLLLSVALPALAESAPLAVSSLPAPEPGAPRDHVEPIVIHRNYEPTFPFALRQKLLNRGEARILVMVDRDGRLADWIVTGYSHPLFAKEALDALQKWTYSPARLDGTPITTRAELHFTFASHERVRMVPADMVLELWTRDLKRDGFWQGFCEADKLDAPVDAIVEINPMSPDRLGAKATEGSVVVDYYIDADGRVRMPLILSSDDDAFTQSVLLAITEWRYAVPRREDQPVMTRVWRRFDFKPVAVANNG